MNACWIVLLLSAALSGTEFPLDLFDYADSQVARAVWSVGSGVPAVEVIRQGDRNVMQFAVPFATQPRLARTILDRQVALDLASVGGFSLELAVDPPEAAGHLSLYFRSGEGWYAAGGSLRQKGPQRLDFSKAAFRIEGRPAGWHKIDGIRISIWRGASVDGVASLRRLAAWRHDVALVVPDPGAEGDRGEGKAARETAETVGQMLAELGLGSDAVEEAALAHNALGQRRVAVLAYNPRLSSQAIDALEQFVEGGGKLLVCYSLPSRLGRLLGFANPRYVRRERLGQFAEIRFDAPDVAGLPSSVRQASWNITTAKPAGHNARVIGRWFDDRGHVTGLPAMLLSDRGAFPTHIVLRDDREGKKQMLAAVLGYMAPALWRRMAQAEIERIDAVGHVRSWGGLAEFVESAGGPAAARLADAAEWKRKAAAALAAGQYPASVEAARRARDLAAEAYLRAQPSPAVEGRAIWNHSGTGAYDGDWERTARELKAAGFNMVIPNMLWGGLAHYASEVLPRSKTYAEHGDQIAQCVDACHRHGIEVHVWKVNWNLSTAPNDFVEKMRKAGRTQVTAGGEPCRWLCPSHPENQQLELESMLEVTRKYDVDGLHFDYIRYPGSQCCYCDGCRRRFEAERGEAVARWPNDCHGGPLTEQYRTWRCANITRLVEAVSREAKKLKPNIKISAAVFGAYPSCRESVGQDWPAWIEAGYLDFVCPMDYTQSDLAFENLLRAQLQRVGGRIPVYPGIGAFRLSPDRTVGQIYHARRLGAPGFTIFNLDARSIGTQVTAIGAGVGAQAATPPHDEK